MRPAEEPEICPKCGSQDSFHEVNGVPRREGKSATLNFRKLYADDPVASGGVADLKVTDEMAAATR